MMEIAIDRMFMMKIAIATLSACHFNTAIATFLFGTATLLLQHFFCNCNTDIATLYDATATLLRCPVSPIVILINVAVVPKNVAVEFNCNISAVVAVYGHIVAIGGYCNG
ncbi:hypothetical protein OROMI_004729 [Orobanche minor]